MTKHIHEKLIHAWAEGAEIESKFPTNSNLQDDANPHWLLNLDYRVKVHDIVKNERIFFNLSENYVSIGASANSNNVQLTFDGITSKLISVEMIK